MSALKQVLGLVGCVLLCFGAAAVGSIFTSQSVGTWYQELARPTWTPPDSVFGPAWSALYLMMGVALWLVWRQAGPSQAGPAIAVFLLQLGLNTLWSVLFFGLRNPGVAFVEIVALWLAILGTLVLFRRVTPVAGMLLIPYLGWVSFAAALNFAIWRMNG